MDGLQAAVVLAEDAYPCRDCRVHAVHVSDALNIYELCHAGPSSASSRSTSCCSSCWQASRGATGTGALEMIGNCASMHNPACASPCLPKQPVNLFHKLLGQHATSMWISAPFRGLHVDTLHSNVIFTSCGLGVITAALLVKVCNFTVQVRGVHHAADACGAVAAGPVCRLLDTAFFRCEFIP